MTILGSPVPAELCPVDPATADSGRGGIRLSCWAGEVNLRGDWVLEGKGPFLLEYRPGQPVNAPDAFRDPAAAQGWFYCLWGRHITNIKLTQHLLLTKPTPTPLSYIQAQFGLHCPVQIHSHQGSFCSCLYLLSRVISWQTTELPQPQTGMNGITPGPMHSSRTALHSHQPGATWNPVYSCKSNRLPLQGSGCHFCCCSTHCLDKPQLVPSDNGAAQS